MCFTGQSARRSEWVLCPRSESKWYQQLVGEASMSPLGHRRLPYRSRPGSHLLRLRLAPDRCEVPLTPCTETCQTVSVLEQVDDGLTYEDQDIQPHWSDDALKISGYTAEHPSIGI